MNQYAIANLLLRAGVAFAFLYAAVDAFVDPFSWIDYFPSFLQGANTITLLHLFGVVEILLALWLLWGKKIFIPSLAGGLALLFIVVFNLSEFQLLFRDVSIAAAALSLAAANYPKRS